LMPSLRLIKQPRWPETSPMEKLRWQRSGIRWEQLEDRSMHLERVGLRLHLSCAC
jgi:hypothetical protein